MLLAALVLAMPAWAQRPSVSEATGAAVADRAPEPPHDPVAVVPLAAPALITGTVESPHFRIEHTARASTAAEMLQPRLEQARGEVEHLLGVSIPGQITIRLGVGREQMDALAVPGHSPPKWASALAYPGLQLMLLDAANLTEPEGQSTLRHELAHLALGAVGGTRFPRWFQEGVAMRVAGEQTRVTQYAALFRAVHQDRLFHFEDLSDEFPAHPGDAEIAYAQSAAFVGYLEERFGPAGMSAVIEQLRGGAPFELAFARALKTTVGVEENGWRAGLHWRYGWIPVASTVSLLWLLSSLLCVVAYLRLRRMVALKRAAQAAEEAAEDAAAAVLAREEAGAEDDPATIPEGFSRWGDPAEGSPEPDEVLDPRGPGKPTLH